MKLQYICQDSLCRAISTAARLIFREVDEVVAPIISTPVIFVESIKDRGQNGHRVLLKMHLGRPHRPIVRPSMNIPASPSTLETSLIYSSPLYTQIDRCSNIWNASRGDVKNSRHSQCGPTSIRGDGNSKSGELFQWHL